MTQTIQATDFSRKDLQVFEYILQHGKDIVSLHFFDQKKDFIAAAPPKAIPYQK